MGELQQFLFAVENDREGAIRLAGVTAQKLTAQQTNLIHVVQSLGEYINDEDAAIRGKAVSYLTAVLKALPSNFLSRQQIQVLTTFYCDRIEDTGAITGLDLLQGLARFSKDMAQLIARGLFQHASHFQARSQSQRFQVLQLLNELMSRYREALLDMEDESLVGIVQLVDGERDPRNLMLVFSILKAVMIEWNISKHVQTMFDAVYKYFPVTFRSHPNDPYKITAQDLKDRLQGCIASNQAFASYAFPSLLEKLDSTSINVKRDALNAIKACISSYGPSVLSRYSITIWDSLKFEILNVQEDILAEESLRILQLLSQRLSSPDSDTVKQSWLAQYLKPIIRECHDQLREPQQKQAKPAQQISTSVASVSPAAFTLVSQAAIPFLLTGYQTVDGTSKQRALLDTLVGLFDSAIGIYGTWKEARTDQVFDNPLVEFKDQLTGILSKALIGPEKGEAAIRLAAIQGLLRLSMLRGFLQDNEIGLYVQYFDDILLNELSVEPQLRERSAGALREISNHKPTLLIEITIPAFMDRLPDVSDDTERDYLAILEYLAQISTQKDVFYTLVSRLLNKLETVLSPENSSSPTYARSILMTILYATDHKGLESDPHLAMYYDRIVRNLCHQAVLSAVDGNKASPLTDTAVLDTLGRLCTVIVRSLPHDMHQEVCNNIYRLYSTRNGIGYFPNSTASERQTMILSTYLLAGLPKRFSNLDQTSSDMASLLKQIAQLTASEDNPSIQLAFARQLALLVNKFLPVSDLGMASELLFSLMPNSSHRGTTPQIIRTIFWLSKALILRLPPTTTQILSSLVELLALPDSLARDASAKGFRLLLSADDILSLENGANIRLLAKQRVFTTVVPLISEKVSAFNTVQSGGASTPSQSNHGKQVYLTALSGMLSTLPPSLLLPELPKLLPLLLQSLDLKDSESQPTKAATLQTLALIIRERGVYAIHEIGYVEELVTRLLQNAVAVTAATTIDNGSSRSSALVRLRAVQCLLLLAQPQAADNGGLGAPENGRPSPLLPLKNRVLRSLKFVLDDPKRNVRKAAVDARVLWLKQGGDESQVDDQ